MNTHKKEPNYKLNYSNNKISLLFAATNETISTQWFNIIKMKFTQTIKRTYMEELIGKTFSWVACDIQLSSS